MPDKTVEPKRIVYLVGAGATQGEVEDLGAARLNLLMQDSDRLGVEGISAGILRRVGEDAGPFLTDQGLDIEKLISLLGTCGVDHLRKLAERMRRSYFEEIRDRLVEARVIERPELAIALLDLHRGDAFRQEVEALSCVITTNHDGLLQVASQAAYGGVNLGFPFVSRDFTINLLLPPILQLHGSFTWQFAVPTDISRLRPDSQYSGDTVWIPPSILKESKSYPFNKLVGLAYELLAHDCDVLRVIGASLTQNDWNILSLIFNAQRHREMTRGAAFTIELVMPEDSGVSIRAQCSYLKNMLTIGDLTEGDFSEYKETADIPADSDLNNPFAYWLYEKLSYHRTRGELSVISAAMTRVLGEPA